MTRLRHLGRLATIASISALVVGACGGATPASPVSGATAPGGSGAATGANGLVEYPATTDPTAGGRAELGLVHQLRDEAGMPALLGAHGTEVFTALDAIEATFGKKVLQDAAGVVDGGAAFDRPRTGVPLRDQLASTRRSAPAAPAMTAAIDTSVFADTGFTTSALMQIFAGIVRLAGTNGSGSLPRTEHFSEDAGGLHQDVDLGSTISITSGGGHVSGDVQLTATDRISKADGTFVALYTSTASGHFDVNACPDGGGIAAGTYSFQTKHELNDVSGSANVQSGAGRSASGPFQVHDGDDAALQSVSATLDLSADSRGPGSPSGPGPTAPFDGKATQTVNLVMPANGGTTQSGDPATVTGTGGAAASGSLFVSSALAQLFLAEVGKEAEKYWRSGDCVELKPSRDSGTVDPEEKVDLTVTAKAKYDDKADIHSTIEAAFSGKESLDPNEQPDTPAHFAFQAGKDEGDKGTIDLTQTSRRGIGKKQVVYTVSGKPLLVSVSSTSVANIGVTLTYKGTVTDLKLARAGDAAEGKGSMKVTFTLKLSATGARCDGSASRSYDLGIKAVPVPKPSDQPNAKDELDLSFEYAVGQIDTVTITCKTKEGTGSMPTIWTGLTTLLPPPGEIHRVTVGETLRFSIPGVNNTTVAITVRKPT